MRILLAGATGVIGRRLAMLLVQYGHAVTAITRSPARIEQLRSLATTPVVIDVFDADGLAGAVAAARPDVIMHQLTNLPSAPGTPGYAAALAANRRLRIEGTAHLMRAAQLACVRRVIAQSVAFVYAPAEGIRVETDPLDRTAARQLTVEGIVALEQEVLKTPGVDGVALRYGFLYGPDTWYAAPPRPPSVHVDAAAHAARLAVNRGTGVYNIADDDGAVSTDKAKRELGFDAAFRMARTDGSSASVACRS